MAATESVPYLANPDSSAHPETLSDQATVDLIASTGAIIAKTQALLEIMKVDIAVTRSATDGGRFCIRSSSRLLHQISNSANGFPKGDTTYTAAAGKPPGRIGAERVYGAKSVSVYDRCRLRVQELCDLAMTLETAEAKAEILDEAERWERLALSMNPD